MQVSVPLWERKIGGEKYFWVIHSMSAGHAIIALQYTYKVLFLHPGHVSELAILKCTLKAPSKVLYWTPQSLSSATS
jgi:hypothetical protein